jgi:hypothetical protein
LNLSGIHFEYILIIIECPDTENLQQTDCLVIAHFAKLQKPKEHIGLLSKGNTPSSPVLSETSVHNDDAIEPETGKREYIQNIF